MDTKIYEYLLKIADTGSISKAAAQFYLSEPSLSRHVKNVEKELGHKIFMHHGKHLILTDSGRIFFNSIYAILQIQKDAEQKLKAINGKENQEINIIYPKIFSTYVQKFYEDFSADSNIQIRLNEQSADPIKVPANYSGLIFDISTSSDYPDFICLPIYEGKIYWVLPENKIGKALPIVIGNDNQEILKVKMKAIDKIPVSKPLTCQAGMDTVYSMLNASYASSILLDQELSHIDSSHQEELDSYALNVFYKSQSLNHDTQIVLNFLKNYPCPLNNTSS